MEKIIASVCILTRNSAETLPRTLASIADFADIVVSDSGSTDDTVAIAERGGARIIRQKSNGPITDFSIERNHLIANAKHDWILMLDSDETATPQLCEDIRHLIAAASSPLLYRIPMGLTYEGREVRYFSSLPGYHVRVFSKKSNGQYVKPIHERFDAPGLPIGTLKGRWMIHWDARRKQSAAFDTHLRNDAALGADQPLMSFIRWKIVRQFVGILAIIGYVIWARGCHRWSLCAPLWMEWQKIRYKALHIIFALQARYR